MKNFTKQKKGITLIALIITVIVMLILTGVTINMVFGDNGLIGKAGVAVGQYKSAEQEELDMLNEIEKAMWSDWKSSENKVQELPENTEETEPGTKVKMPENWYITTPAYVSTEDGSVVQKSVQVASVYAVAVGGGKTVPVPDGFYYVGGDLDTGVIISDDPDDQYDGETDKTTYAYTTSLKGNQFVWIPCTLSNYHKTDKWNNVEQKPTSSYTNYSNCYWDTTIADAETTQVRKYGGFYVGRYEAGLATSIDEFTTTQQHTGANQIYNKAGVPQSRAGQIPWMFIDWNTAKTNAESMYNTNYVRSGLITGTQWDVMLNWMNDNKADRSMLTSGSNWGNYNNTTLSNVTGKYCTINSSNGSMTSAWQTANWTGDTKKPTGYYLLSTGSTEDVKKKNIYETMKKF